ncbi:MAG: hypothetical protein ACETVM_05010, partial [Candidatus Bathyarchaeia archaeon]
TTAEEVEEVRQILGVVSAQLPALIKGIVSAVFSEEAGRNMGRAAAAFYKELKDSGMPDEIAVKMTEDYIGVFTSLGDILKQAGKKGKAFGNVVISAKEGEEIGKEIEKLVKEKMSKKLREKEEQE